MKFNFAANGDEIFSEFSTLLVVFDAETLLMMSLKVNEIVYFYFKDDFIFSYFLVRKILRQKENTKIL